jgi:hypothetical protein
VQVLVQHAPALQAPLVHVEVVDAKTQFCASFAQVASVVELAHALPTALQTGSALHVQAAVPDEPVQLWCGWHPTGVPYE